MQLMSVTEAFFLVSVDETQYCYCTEAELQFGNNRLLSSKEVQQSDSLSSILFSLDLPTWWRKSNNHLIFSYKCGTWKMAPSLPLHGLFQHLPSDHGARPYFGLILNIEKCEISWPCGDISFPDFLGVIKKPRDGINLLASPFWGIA